MSVAGFCRCTYQYVSLCVPDCSSLTSEGLLHFSNFSSLETLALERLNVRLLNGQDGQKDPGRWIRGLSPSMKELIIIGELRWHIPAANVQGPAVAMVHTRVRPILSTGTHTLKDGEMFYQLFKPHHRELEIDCTTPT